MDTPILSTFATNTLSDGAGALLLFIVVALCIVFIAACWRTFQKAKKPGWNSIIPLYNTYVLLKIVGRPGWWLLWYFVPVVNAIVHLIVSIDLAKTFRKGVAFGVFGLWLFPIGYLILGFGSAKYKGVPKR